ncbi:putative DNA repair protein Rad4 [Hamiltosporidium magnivora]|uniref:Putative DNA repair protein Rad4 n=1 Tax=Hamiltosporidium magnivora TaxID=148818 RepID=A0A4Q9LND1_9MICR|nr:putative DNA repair protein Rad4 [Hamiltosporidium magnivora]
MDSSDSWNEVFSDDLFVPLTDNIDAKKKIFDKKVLFAILSSKFLFCIKKIIKTIKETTNSAILDLMSEECNNYNKFQILISKLKDFKFENENDKNIFIFCHTVHQKIPCRLFFVLGKPINTFLETKLLNNLIYHPKKYPHLVFSIDSKFNITNQTLSYSSSSKNFSFFEKIFLVLDQLLINNNNSDFDKENDKKLKEIPNSIQKYKKHPIYILESLIKTYQIIYPKRPILGYFKGEPIYYKSNIINLLTEKQLYRKGLKPKDKKPYKIIYNSKQEKIYLYAPWQTCKIEILEFDSKDTMDFYHENFIPINCTHINDDKADEVAELLQIEYRKCFKGFYNGFPKIEGIFIESKHKEVFEICLKEYKFNTRLDEIIEKRMKVFKNWNIFLKKVDKYNKIIDRLEK